MPLPAPKQDGIEAKGAGRDIPTAILALSGINNRDS